VQNPPVFGGIMSYDISYRTLFITDGDQLLLLEETGPSNTYVGWGKHQKRARDWFVLGTPAFGRIFKKEAVLKALLHEVECTDYAEYIKINGKFVTRRNYFKLMHTRAKHAISVFDTFRLGIADTLRLRFSFYVDDEYAWVDSPPLFDAGRFAFDIREWYVTEMSKLKDAKYLTLQPTGYIPEKLKMGILKRR